MPLGDAALLVEGVLPAGPAPSGVTDVVSAFGTTAVSFDPCQIGREDVSHWMADCAEATVEAIADDGLRTHRVPTRYGDEFGPDLDGVAQHAGLSADEVVRRHAATEYTVGAVGFRPGFGYLGGLPAELHTPRHDSPRTRVDPGSVAIGGPYTGVYPDASPGGWRVIGRSPLRLFDPRRAPPALLRVGDRVRFEPIDAVEFDRQAAAVARATDADPTRSSGEPRFRVVRPGMMTALVGAPAEHRQHLGVSPGGAMDPFALRVANRLAGAPDAAVAIEMTLVGAVLECLAEATVGLAGAVETPRRVRVRRGDTLDLGRLVGGARAYVAVAGGLGDSDPLKGVSRLEAGEVVHASYNPLSTDSREPPVGDGLRLAPPPYFAAASPGEPRRLRVVPAPESDLLDDRGWRVLLESTFRVSPRSDRMGVRLEGPAVMAADSSGRPSGPVCHGAIQLPPDGQPLLLGADRQTLGGYPLPAAIVSADWPALGQLRPGDAVRFERVDLPTADRLRREQQAWLAHASAGIATRTLA